jgi:tetratricopeptide (TPR) repeat protein
MTKKITLYILLVFTSLSLNAQISNLLVTDSISKAPKIPNKLYQYYKYANNAKWQYYSKNYKEAIFNYKKAFFYNIPQAEHLEDLVDCYRGLNEIDSAIFYAEICIRNFGLNVNRMYHDSGTNAFYNLSIFKQPLGEFYTKGNVLRNYVLLEHYMLNDRFFRSKFKEFDLGKENCINDIGGFSFKIALQYDSIYAIPYILDLIKDFNFPNAYDIGSQSVGYLMFLLRHYNIEKYVLDSALVNGKILPEQYASLVDYKFNVDWETLINEGKLKPKNNFGPNLREINGKMIVGELDDIENVDKRRDEIGLMPLWQYAKYKNFELSDAYKKVLGKKKVKYQ